MLSQLPHILPLLCPDRLLRNHIDILQHTYNTYDIRKIYVIHYTLATLGAVLLGCT